jgi:hypothetical protein
VFCISVAIKEIGGDNRLCRIIGKKKRVLRDGRSVVCLSVCPGYVVVVGGGLFLERAALFMGHPHNKSKRKKKIN